jgi:hypothetical protein
MAMEITETETGFTEAYQQAVRAGVALRGGDPDAVRPALLHAAEYCALTPDAAARMALREQQGDA